MLLNFQADQRIYKSSISINAITKPFPWLMTFSKETKQIISILEGFKGKEFISLMKPFSYGGKQYTWKPAMSKFDHSYAQKAKANKCGGKLRCDSCGANFA